MTRSVVTFNITTLTTFELSEHDTLIIKPVLEGIEFSHVREGSKPYTLAVFNAGKWKFNNEHDRSLFLQLVQLYPKEFRRSFKKYFQSTKKSEFYTIICAKRKFTIWSQKLNNSIWDKFYSSFYGR